MIDYELKLNKLIHELNLDEENFKKFIYNKNLLATALEVASISGRLLVKRNNDLNKIYVKNLIALYLQLDLFVYMSEMIYKIDNEYKEGSKFTDNVMKQLVFDDYYSPYDLTEEDQFNLCNNIGIMCSNFATAIWKDFENNIYDVVNMSERYKVLGTDSQSISFIKFVLELMMYTLVYIDRHNEDFLRKSISKVFHIDEEPVKEVIKASVKDALIDGDQIKEFETETKIIEL